VDLVGSGWMMGKDASESRVLSPSCICSLGGDSVLHPGKNFFSFLILLFFLFFVDLPSEESGDIGFAV